jgi:hypothetical protein
MIRISRRLTLVYGMMTCCLHGAARRQC